MSKLDHVKIGDVFGDLIVEAQDQMYRRYVLCSCVCRAKIRVDKYHLLGGKSKRCNECRRTKPQVDLTGTRTGMLTVAEYVGKKSGTRGGKAAHHWLCQCDCGAKCEVRGDHLGAHARGILTNKSCGCQRIGSNNYGWKGIGDLSGQKWGQIIKGARERNILITLTMQEAWELFLQQDKKCALTGFPLVMHSIKPLGITASLDRIDSLKGYTLDNVQWTHKDINMLKNDYDQDYFISLCKAVAAHR